MLLALDTGANGAGVSNRIKDGDLVVLYETHDQMKLVRVQAGKSLQNRFGSFAHNDWIGKPFGCKVFASKKNGTQGGFVYLLALTPELWTKVLAHRTQILYMPDIAMVVSHLNLAPGCTVLESGTGSGSLTHSLGRAVAPSGRVRTFEFHELRAQAARDDLEKNGLSGVVQVDVRDIQGEGFPSELESAADAVFLDLPGPWLAVPSAASCLKPNGMFCSFSPCIEQVQKCSEALRQQRFTDLRTFEVLLRTYDLHTCGPRQQSDGSRDKHPGQTGLVNKPSTSEARHAHAVSGTPAAERGLWMKPMMEARGHTGYLLFARLWT